MPATYVCDHVQDRLDLIDGLLNTHCHLRSQLLILLKLLAGFNLLFGFLWLFWYRFGFWLWNIFEDGNMSYCFPFTINDVAARD